MNNSFPPVSDIKRIRKSLDITQTELAAASGVSQSTIAKIERNKMSASYETVVKLFETLEGMRKNEKRDLTAADVSVFCEGMAMMLSCCLRNVRPVDRVD